MVNNKLENDVLTFINWFDERSSTSKKDFKKLFRIAKYVNFVFPCFVFPTLFFSASWLNFANKLNDIVDIVLLCVCLALSILFIYQCERIFQKTLKKMCVPCFKENLNSMRLGGGKKSNEEQILKTIEYAKLLHLDDALVNRLIDQKHDNSLFWDALFWAFDDALEYEKQRTKVPENLTFQQKKELLKTSTTLESVQVDATDPDTQPEKILKKSFWKI